MDPDTTGVSSEVVQMMTHARMMIHIEKGWKENFKKKRIRKLKKIEIFVQKTKFLVKKMKFLAKITILDKNRSCGITCCYNIANFGVKINFFDQKNIFRQNFFTFRRKSSWQQ